MDGYYSRLCNIAQHYKDGTLTEDDMRYSIASVLRDQNKELREIADEFDRQVRRLSRLLSE